MRLLRRLSLVRALLRRKQARIERLEELVWQGERERDFAEAQAARLREAVAQQHLVIARLKTALAALERVEG